MALRPCYPTPSSPHTQILGQRHFVDKHTSWRHHNRFIFSNFLTIADIYIFFQIRILTPRGKNVWGSPKPMAISTTQRMEPRRKRLEGNTLKLYMVLCLDGAPTLVCSLSFDFANFLSSSPCKIEMSEINCRWMTGRWKGSFLSPQTLSLPAAQRHAHQDTRPQSETPTREVSSASHLIQGFTKHIYILKDHHWAFPVVQRLRLGLPANAGDTASNPAPGRSHMLQGS